MRKQSLVLVFGALVVTLAAAGLIGIQSASNTRSLTDSLVEQTSPSLHILGHLKSAASRLVGVATQLSSQGDLADPLSGAGTTFPTASLEAFDNAYVTFQEEVGQFEVMQESGDLLQQSLLTTSKDLMGHAAIWREAFAGSREGETLGQLRAAERAFSSIMEDAIAAEVTQLVQESEPAERSARQLHLLNVATTTAAILLAVVFGGLVVQQIAMARTRQEHLQAAKVDLEREVAEHARQLETTNRALYLQLEQRRQVEADNVERNRRLKGLLQVSQQLAGHFTLEKRLDAVVGGVLATVPTAEAASLWLYDVAGEKLEARAWSGYDADDVTGLHSPSISDLAYLVYRSGQTRLVNGSGDVSTLTTEAIAGLDNVDGHRAILGVPLLADGGLIGVLCADSVSAGNAFDAEDLRLLQSLADQAALAIKNVQLLDVATQHRRELQRLSTKLMAVREAECKRISRELHDVMGQALTAVSINLAKMKQELPDDAPAIVQERIAESESLTLQTLSDLRELSLELRPSMLDDLGLLPTLRWYVRQFGRRLNVAVTFETAGVRDRLPPEVETVLYRVVQEGLTNVARHAQAQESCVYLNCDGETLALNVTDDGKGFDTRLATTLAPGTTGMGLLGMRERVAAVGGRLRVESSPGRGTRLSVTMECPPPACPEKGKKAAEIDG